MADEPNTVAASTGLSDNAAGALAYLTVIPAIIFLIVEPYNKNSFVRFNCLAVHFSVLCRDCSGYRVRHRARNYYHDVSAGSSSVFLWPLVSCSGCAGRSAPSMRSRASGSSCRLLALSPRNRPAHKQRQASMAIGWLNARTGRAVSACGPF